MLKPQPQDSKLYSNLEEEILEKLVAYDHPFRMLKAIIDFNNLLAPCRKLYSHLGAEGIDVVKGFSALLIQHWDDYSDRQLERALKENVAVKWFCGFELLEQTPDHSYFGKLRGRLGAKAVADIFNSVNEVLRSYGLFGDVFKFIDASSIISKNALWKERDKAIANGEKQLNNKNVHKYAADQDARWGAKGKDNFWFGYKRLESVDMRFGLIDKLTVTPANVLDYEAMGQICPKNCMVFTDKLFDCKKATKTLQANGCHSAVILKNNNPNKNTSLDRWRSKVRMPFEGIFSKARKRARFRGRVKVLFQCFAEALCHNLRKAIRFKPALAAA